MKCGPFTKLLVHYLMVLCCCSWICSDCLAVLCKVERKGNILCRTAQLVVMRDVAVSLVVSAFEGGGINSRICGI